MQITYYHSNAYELMHKSRFRYTSITFHYIKLYTLVEGIITKWSRHFHSFFSEKIDIHVFMIAY